MLAALQELSRLCTRTSPAPSTEDIEAACCVVQRVLGASDVYVIRAGDPAFERVGCPCPPTDYEIKQKGYWLVWRRLASQAGTCACLFDVQDRLVTGERDVRAGAPATHVAMILPYNESNLDLLVARGPWPTGLSDEQIQFLEASRPMLALLVGNVLDADRRERQQEQLRALATLSDAFNRAQEGDDVLTAMATALARASGIEWITILTYDESCTAIVDRGMNITRHYDTETAAVFRGPRSEFTEGEIRLGVTLAQEDRYIAIPDVFAEDLLDQPQVAPMRQDLPSLQRYWQRAHVLSIAIFPITVQGRPLGMVSFSATTARSFDEKEVEFLRALVSQVAPAVRGIQLLRALHESREELRQSEERFRSLVQNASDLITVIDEDTTVLYQSPSIRAVLGYEPQAIVGRQLIDLVHADDLETARAALRSAGVHDGPP